MTDDALARYRTWEKKDPFPDIPPALLNSAHIEDYARTTGMIDPFDGENNLKPASYALQLDGICVQYGEKNKELARIHDGEEYRVPPNSISFVTLRPKIQLPAYIAARFNLKIDLVYRGFLLGTGPLVDPGWSGHLSFPLHNLTDQEYTLRGGDTLIWMEFTKTSPIPGLDYEPEAIPEFRSAQYKPYADEKKDPSDDVEKRIARALRNTHALGIRSSLAGTLNQTKAEAKKSREQAHEAQVAAEAARGEAESARQETKRISDRAITLQMIIAGVSAVAVVLGLAQIVSLASTVDQTEVRNVALDAVTKTLDARFQSIHDADGERKAEITDLVREVKALGETRVGLSKDVQTLQLALEQTHQRERADLEATLKRLLDRVEALEKPGK